MIIKETKTSFTIGDLIEVTRNDGKKFKGIVVENYSGGFVCKVLHKDKDVGTASWSRYGLVSDSRFQSITECQNIEVLAKATKSSASSTFTLNESVTKSNLTYYETPIDENLSSTLCICDGFGGWSFSNKLKSGKLRSDALKESFFNSQISKLRTTESVINN